MLTAMSHCPDGKLPWPFPPFRSQRWQIGAELLAGASGAPQNSETQRGILTLQDAVCRARLGSKDRAKGTAPSGARSREPTSADYARDPQALTASHKSTAPNALKLSIIPVGGSFDLLPVKRTAGSSLLLTPQRPQHWTLTQ